MIASFGMLVVHALWQGTLVGLGALALWPWLRGVSPAVRCAVAQGALLLFPVATVLTALGPSVASPVGSSSAPGWLAALGWIWFVGASLGALRLSLGVAHTRRLRRTALEVPETWRRRFDQLCAQMGVRAPAFGLHDGVDGPCVVGVLKPMVLLPGRLLTGLPEGQLELLLRHELAHLRRLDPLLNALQSVVETLYFFHPVVWWLSRQARTERELACDDLAACTQPERIDLARALASLAERQPSPTALAANGGPLMTRIQRLIHPPVPARRRARWLPAALVVTTTLAFAVVACVSEPEVEAPPEERAAAYADILADASAHYELPEELLHRMVAAESNFDPNAVSPAGAMGLMQLMPKTADALGVEDPFDPRQNVFGGAAYLKEMLERFDGDVTMAVAAYNAGPNAVTEAGGVPQNGETPQYVARVLEGYAPSP